MPAVPSEKDNLRKATEIRAVWHAGETEFLRDVFVGEILEAVGVDAVVADTKFVDQVWRKKMGLTERQAAKSVVFGAVLKRAAVERVMERRRREARLIFVAEAAKEAVFVGDVLVDADVGVVAALGELRLRNVVDAS